ncbi:MAG: hypothetical protein WBD47_02195 [Phormidesmis sp.]
MFPSKPQTKMLVVMGVLGSFSVYFAQASLRAGRFVDIMGKRGQAALAQVPSSQSGSENFLSLQEWFKAGSHPEDYDMGADNGVTYSGDASGTIRALEGELEGFGTLMQVFDAENYQGQRLRLRGYVKAAAVEDWAGLWMRVDGASNQVLGFDNMQNRPIRGTVDWQPYDVVLDVPAESSKIAFGLLLGGSGQVWMDDLQFEVVDETVPTTDLHSDESEQLRSPTNLSFEAFE